MSRWATGWVLSSNQGSPKLCRTPLIVESCECVTPQRRRYLILSIVSLVVVGLCLSLSSNLSSPAVAQSGGVTVAAAEKIVQLTNQVRAKNGLPALAALPPLNTAALGHSQEMLELDYFSHTSPVTGKAGDRIKQAGVRWTACAENIYRSEGYPIEEVAAETVDAWVRSPGHYKNIIGPNYTHIGVGVIYKNDEAVVTQVFARL